MTYERVQILLEPRQRRALQQLAKRQNKSVSEVVREMTEQYVIEKETDLVLQTLDNFRALRDRQCLYQGDPVADVRADREREINDIMKGTA